MPLHKHLLQGNYVGMEGISLEALNGINFAAATQPTLSGSQFNQLTAYLDSNYGDKSFSEKEDKQFSSSDDDGDGDDATRKSKKSIQIAHLSANKSNQAARYPTGKLLLLF
jgi:hypothetical protein